MEIIQNVKDLDNGQVLTEMDEHFVNISMERNSKI